MQWLYSWSNSVLEYREINYELNKSIDSEQITLEMLTSDISCKKIKLNILNLNSEIESLFDSKEEKINATYSKWVHINCFLFKINQFF